MGLADTCLGYCGCPNDKLIRISGTYHPHSYEEEEVELVAVFL